jgi:hypothetical protein
MSPLRFRTLLAAATLLCSGATTAHAQQIPDLPPETRIRVLVRGDEQEHEFVGKLERSDALSLRMIDERSGELRNLEWGRINRLERSEGRRPYSAFSRVGAAAGVTAFGAVLGWSTWHTCNDPESDGIFACIVMPERLGTSVRAGTWVGLTVGFITALAMTGSEQWRALDLPRGVALTLSPSANGTAVGFRIRF